MLSFGVTKQVLGNGLTVLIKENHASPTVAILTYVKAGYFNESDRLAGISHLIEHMFFKGTRRRGVGEIGNETKALGGYLNASTIYDHTLYDTVLPSRNFSRGLDIQSDALLYSVFDPAELKKETEVVIQEAKRKLDTPSAVATEKLFELAFDRHRIRRWRIGTEDGLRALTRDDFLSFHENLYRPQNMILVVVGDVETAKALNEIETYYGAFERGDLRKEESLPEQPQTQFKYRHLRGDIQQAYLEIGFHAPPLLHPDSYAMEMLAFILGYGRSSRLYQNVKETRQLANSISASNYILQDVGIFLIDANGKSETLREAISAIMEEIGKIRKKGVISEELERARNLIEASYVFSQESCAGQANLLAAYQAHGDYRLVEEYLQNLYAVTEADVVRVANQYLCLTNCSLLEYVPESSKLRTLAIEEIEAGLIAHFMTTAAFPDSPEVKHETPAVFDYASNSGQVGQIKQYELTNGMTVLIKEIHQLPMVSAGVFAKGGRALENPDNAGLTGLTLRTSLKGAGNRTAAEIAMAIENLGSAIHFSNNPDYCSFSQTILSKNFEAGFDILADIAARPSLLEEEIVKEKENTLAQIRRERDDMFQHPLNLFYSTLFKNHPYGLPVYGEAERIINLKRDDIAAWQRRLFHAKNMVLALVGDLETERVLDLVQRKLGTISSLQNPSQRQSEIPPLAEIVMQVESREKQQSALALGFFGPAYGSDDYYNLTVLQNVVSGLGGRFFEELRGRQSLAYTVSAFLVARQETGAFVSYIATSPEREEIAKNGLLKELDKLTQEQITEEELERAIRYTVGVHQIGLETYRAQMLEYAHNFLLGTGLDEVENFPQRIESVSREDILSASQKYFAPDRYAIGIVRGRT